MKSMIRKIFPAIMVVAIVAITCISAFAIDASYSSKSTATVGGRTYTYYSYIERWNEEKLCARVYAGTSKVVPIGYIGLQSRMYNSNGALEQSSDWRYSEIECVSFDSYVYVRADSNDYYYSKGRVKLYNGNGYTTYTANASPNMSLQMSRTPVQVTINENGDVYGSEIFLEAIGVEADLIYAIGENGVEGYVKATDLEGPVIKTPAEAVRQVRVNRTIPLYASDGISVIGSFVIQNNDSMTIIQ